MEIAEGTVEARLELAPFALTIGQATLSDGATRVRASGRISADEAGWRVALDAGLDGVEVERALALWPAPLTPGLKRWLDGHLHSGRIADFDFGLRTAPEYGRRLALDFDFRDAALTPVPTMPRVTGASGRASLAGETFTLALETGVQLCLPPTRCASSNGRGSWKTERRARHAPRPGSNCRSRMGSGMTRSPSQWRRS